MRQVYTFLIALATIAFAIAGCGGGGGGGSSSSAPEINVTGWVVGSDGSGIASASVTLSSGSGTSWSATTGTDGSYSLSRVLVGTSLTLTVTAPGAGTRSWSGLQIDTTNVSGSAQIIIALPLDLLTAGSTIDITPDLSAIALGDTPLFTIRVRDASGAVLYNSYHTVWVVVGNIPTQIPSGSPYFGRYLALSAQTEGTKARITAASNRADGTTVTDTIVVTVTSNGGGTEPPPPPPT